MPQQPQTLEPVERRGWSPPVAAPESVGRELSDAAGGAIDFLLSRRDAGGWWRDYTAVGPSDARVTAYAGAVMADGPAVARAAAWRAWELLRGRGGWLSAGWGQHAGAPPDAETTAWALHLAGRVGAGDTPRARRARRFLARHVRPCGGLAAYAPAGAVRRFTALDPRPGEWSAAHDCVTAAGAALPDFPERPRLLRRLRERQRTDGSWLGYWWPDAEYTTALAAESLAGTAADFARAERAAQWATGRLATGMVTTARDPDGSPFATAGALRALCAAWHSDVRRAVAARAVRWLVRRQRPDGSWPASAWLRVTRPERPDPELVPWRAVRETQGGRETSTLGLDRERVFTTAAVLRALLRAAPVLAPARDLTP